MPRLRFPDHALVLRMVEHCIKSGNPLMIAHDDGVYLCADGLRGADGRMECAYAAGCNPRIDAEWYETARQLVGGDDFGERHDMRRPEAAMLLELLRQGERLVLNLNRQTIAIETDRVVAPPTTPAARGRGTESPPPPTTTARRRNVPMTTTTKQQKKTKPAPKTGERLKNAARAEIASRLEALDGGKQDHEVPTAKEVANNAIVEAAVKAATESPTVANGAPGGKKASAAAKPSKRAPAAAKAPKPAKAKSATPGKEAKAPKPKRVSALDAAAMVLKSAKEPMNCEALIVAMAERKLWVSPNGQTPAQTLYAAITREVQSKGKDARFKKVERGHFAFNGKAG